MPPKRKTKKTVAVTLNDDEMQILLKSLGYTKKQDLLDDLAIGAIRPSADPVAPPTELPVVEDSGRSKAVAQPKSKVDPQNSKRTSWAEVVEATEEIAISAIVAPTVDLISKGTEKQVSQASEVPMSKPWAEIVRGIG